MAEFLVGKSRNDQPQMGLDSNSQSYFTLSPQFWGGCFLSSTTWVVLKPSHLRQVTGPAPSNLFVFLCAVPDRHGGCGWTPGLGAEERAQRRNQIADVPSPLPGGWGCGTFRCGTYRLEKL